MRCSLLPAVMMAAVIAVILFLNGCERSKQSKAEPETQKGAVATQRVPDKPAPNNIETPVPTAIRDQLLSADDIKDSAELYAETIVLDGDNKRLLITGHGQFLCSPTGNCPYWIFRKTADRYEQEIEGSAQTVSVETGKSSFPEVVTRQHGSAFDSELRLYQFDGTRYLLTKCTIESYSDPNDLDHTLDKPIVKEIHC